jgi:hypothetical protein
MLVALAYPLLTLNYMPDAHYRAGDGIDQEQLLINMELSHRQAAREVNDCHDLVSPVTPR